MKVIRILIESLGRNIYLLPEKPSICKFHHAQVIDATDALASPLSSSRVALCRRGDATPRAPCSFLPDRCSGDQRCGARTRPEIRASPFSRFRERMRESARTIARTTTTTTRSAARARRRDACVRVLRRYENAGRSRIATSPNGRYAAGEGRSEQLATLTGD